MLALLLCHRNLTLEDTVEVVVEVLVEVVVVVGVAIAVVVVAEIKGSFIVCIHLLTIEIRNH